MFPIYRGKSALCKSILCQSPLHCGGSLFSFLAPSCCPCCGVGLIGEEAVCPSCSRQLEAFALTTEGRCSICFQPAPATPCKQGRCGDRKLFFDRHISLYALKQKWCPLLHAWKFGNERRLYRAFLPALRSRLPLLKAMKLDRIGYIHSGPYLRQVRNYHPCHDLASLLGKMLNLPSGADIHKLKKEKQSGRSLTDRFFALHGSLRLDLRSIVSASSYLLVEDVFTTGATANEAARLLKQAGVSNVIIISVLQAPLD